MKKTVKVTLIALSSLGYMNSLNAQATNVGTHLGTLIPNDWNGWNTTSTIPFNLKTEANFPINFHTNTGAGLFNLVPRMTILGNGLVGVGLASQHLI